MDERIKEWFKQGEFRYGLITGFSLCIFLAGFVFTCLVKPYFDNQISIKEKDAKNFEFDLKIQQSKNADLRDSLDKAKQYEDKFNDVSLRTRLLERQFVDTKCDLELQEKKYDSILTEKWEEKYNAEHLMRLSKDEELLITKNRLKDATEKALTADPLLIRQNDDLIKQLQIKNDELNRLRLLYTSTQQKLNTIQPVEENNSKRLVAAMKGIYDLDRGAAAIEMIKQQKRPIDGDTFVEVLSMVYELDRGHVVVACAPYIQKNLTQEQISRISKLVYNLDAGAAMKVLMTEQAK